MKEQNQATIALSGSVSAASQRPGWYDFGWIKDEKGTKEDKNNKNTHY